jgi:hypothetical protein
VTWLEGQRLEDEQVERALHDFRLTSGHPTSLIRYRRPISVRR